MTDGITIRTGNKWLHKRCARTLIIKGQLSSRHHKGVV